MSTEINVDVVLGLSKGDEAKAKIAHHLMQKNSYSHVVRVSGGGNAGHTIYKDGKKYVAHLIPVGAVNKIRSIIGPGCVLNVNKFFQELKSLEEFGVENPQQYVKIAKNAHVVTDKHLEEEKNESSIGTTKTGNGPAYRDKYARLGIRAEQIPELKPFLVDMFEEFYDNNEEKIDVLIEGAQGFGLDPDWGTYPYVTSSHCGIGAVLLNGFTHKQIRNVYGAAKVYDTYVGSMEFEPKNDPELGPLMEKIREVGGEYGSTTGRPRQCNFLDLESLYKAVLMNGVNTLVMSKVDVLRTVPDAWRIKTKFENEVYVNYKTEEQFKKAVRSYIPFSCDIIWSESKETI